MACSAGTIQFPLSLVATKLSSQAQSGPGTMVTRCLISVPFVALNLAGNAPPFGTQYDSGSSGGEYRGCGDVENTGVVYY